jgi:hypothetical protein
MTVNKTEQDSEQINNQILVREAWRKAEDDVSRRKQTEFLLWSKSMLIVIYYKFILMQYYLYFIFRRRSGP